MGICCGVAPSEISDKINFPELSEACKVITTKCGVNDWSLTFDAKDFVTSTDTAIAYKDDQVIIIVDGDSFVIKNLNKKIILGKTITGQIVSELMANGINIDNYREHIANLAKKIG